MVQGVCDDIICVMTIDQGVKVAILSIKAYEEESTCASSIIREKRPGGEAWEEQSDAVKTVDSDHVHTTLRRASSSPRPDSTTEQGGYTR